MVRELCVQIWGRQSHGMLGDFPKVKLVWNRINQKITISQIPTLKTLKTVDEKEVLKRFLGREFEVA